MKTAEDFINETANARCHNIEENNKFEKKMSMLEEKGKKCDLEIKCISKNENKQEITNEECTKKQKYYCERVNNRIRSYKKCQ